MYIYPISGMVHDRTETVQVRVAHTLFYEIVRFHFKHKQAKLY